MPLYIFWTSLCLGLMKLSTDAWWQEQRCKPLQPRSAPHGAIHAQDGTPAAAE